MDGSTHPWLSQQTKLKSTLHLAIDDATSMLLGGFFAAQETLTGYYQTVRQLITRYGVPEAFYTDRRSIFEYQSGKSKENSRIQFARACRHLGIEIITTSVPQAKGRVERSFATLQSRLLNELHYYGIGSLPEANQYLQNYIAAHNAKFAISPQQLPSAFAALPKSCDLNKILSIVEPRTVLSGHTISYGNAQYLPQKANGQAILLKPNTKVQTVKTLDNQLLLQYGGKYYSLQLVANGKSTSHTPPPTHPWKQGYGKSLDEQNW
jgi:transposase InsO family protein